MKRFLIFFSIARIAADASSLPPFTTYSVTVRDFMAQPCRKGVKRSYMERWCPNDAFIVSQVLNGTLSGHPDFQRKNDFPLYDYTRGTTRPYANQFPLTSSKPGSLLPFVTQSLSHSTTGIPKMIFCTEERSAIEGYACDVASSKRSVFNEKSFGSWYDDDVKFNKRVGYSQRLYLSDPFKQEYQFDSAQDSPDAFFSPLNDGFNTNQVWPLSLEEREQTNGPHKFFFTTEIHSFFEYKGNEIFSFAGDDDVHVFINDRLAVNLGGVHGFENGIISQSIELAHFALLLGLEVGGVYAFDMFHAEREVVESNFKMTTTLSASCNLVSVSTLNAALVDHPIDWTENGHTENQDWFVLAGPDFGVFQDHQKKIFVLMAPNVPDAVSYFFFAKHRVNVGSGFRFQFEFQLQGRHGHGFSVLFHDRELGLTNFNGGTGRNLGIRNCDHSIALVFDTISSAHELRLHYNAKFPFTNDVSNDTRSVFDAHVVQDWKDNAWHHVEIVYYANPAWLEVYVDQSLRLVKRNISLTDIIGGRDASVGFTSSSSQEAQDLSVRIQRVTIETVKASLRYTQLWTTTSGFPQLAIANGRDTVDFILATFDACNNSLDFGGLSSQVDARLVDITSTTTEEVSDIVGKVVDLNNGQYRVEFSTTRAGNYSVWVRFGNCTHNGNDTITSNDTCWFRFLDKSVSFSRFVTSSPTVYVMPTAPPGIGGEVLSGLGAGVGLVSVCGLFGVVLGLRKRRQWKNDSLYINLGKKAARNRTWANVDAEQLQNQLKITLANLKAERLKHNNEAKVIQDLLQQQGELQEMIKMEKLKRLLESSKKLSLIHNGTNLVLMEDNDRRSLSFVERWGGMMHSIRNSTTRFSSREHHVQDSYSAENPIFLNEAKQPPLSRSQLLLSHSIAV